jgi:hypothetical protein
MAIHLSTAKTTNRTQCYVIQDCVKGGLNIAAIFKDVNKMFAKE